MSAPRSKGLTYDMGHVDDVRIEGLDPLLPPAILIDELPISDDTAEFICRSRRVVEDIVSGVDDRLIVVVGPCSVHDVDAALEYAEKLKPIAEKYKNDLFIIMRTYFEKPRTTVGWKGLITDPDLDGSYKINKGLRLGRKLLRDVNAMGLPCAVEFLDTISPQFIADCVTWGAIGARTTESQIHRQLASGLSMAIGFKNGTDGNVQIACDAIRASAAPQTFLSVTKQGLTAIVKTKGNQYCHVVLRGANSGPNYDEQHVDKVCTTLEKCKLDKHVMIDCSHGNSQKDHRNQPKVCEDVASQLRKGSKKIIGVMIESNLLEGRQDIRLPRQYMSYGVSVTDACVSLETTDPMLENLAKAVAARRELNASSGNGNKRKALESPNGKAKRTAK